MANVIPLCNDDNVIPIIQLKELFKAFLIDQGTVDFLTIFFPTILAKTT